MMKNIKVGEGTCKYCQCLIYWRMSAKGRRYPANPGTIKPHNCGQRKKDNIDGNK